MSTTERVAVLLLVFGLYAAGQESTVVPDASCVTECEAVGNGYQICRTGGGTVRGCTGPASNQALLDGYEPDPSCTTPCQETENGLAFCVDADGVAKGCTGGPSSLGKNDTLSGESVKDAGVNSNSTVDGRLYQVDLSCSTPCQETSQGFVFCTTSSGEVKGCVGGPNMVESGTVTDTIGSVVYIRDSMCTSSCQETDKGLVYCTTSAGKAKGCLPSGSPSMSGNNQSNAGVSTFTGTYRPDPECQGSCVFTENGFAYCATVTGQIRGCLGGAELASPNVDNQGSSAVAEGYEKDASCDSECKSYSGFWACTSDKGQVKGCTAALPKAGESSSAPEGGYSPDPSCTTNCQEVSAGLWGCLTDDEQVRGCVSASEAGKDQLLPQVPGIAQRAAECTTECKSYNGLPACMDGDGRIFGCTGGPAQPSDPDKIIVSPSYGDENGNTSLELTPAPECTTECQATDAGFVICFTQEGKVKGCINNDLLASSTDDSSSGGTNVGAIVGGVIGGLAAVALIAGGVYFYRKKKESASFKKFQDDQSITISLGYDVESSTSEALASSSPQAATVEVGPPTTGTDQPGINSMAVSKPEASLRDQEATGSSTASPQGALASGNPVVDINMSQNV
eukprot:jgi/Picsp_1/171/NSC_00171-R1_---NA---